MYKQEVWREGGRKGKEGRRRHVCRSMIYRLHCRHGDFCQPSLRSKVVVQTAVPQSEGEGGSGDGQQREAGGGGLGAVEGEKRWKGC